MLEHFNADDFIKFLIPARECLRARCDSAKRQAALLQQLQAVRIEFQPSPLMPGRNQPRSVSAGSASDIEDRASSREIIEDKAQYLVCRLLLEKKKEAQRRRTKRKPEP